MRVRQLHCPGVLVGDFTVPASEFREHVDCSAQFSFQLEGTALDRGDDHDAERQCGTVLFRPAGTRHSVHCADGARVVLVEFHPERFAAIDRAVGNLFSAVSSISFKEADATLRKLCLAMERSDSVALLTIESMVLVIVEQLAATMMNERMKVSRPKWLDDALAIIREHFREKITGSTIAGELGVNGGELQHAMQTYEGTSVSDRILQLRVEHAVRRLRNGSSSIAEIAQESGFYDHSQMVRIFRKVVGLTPSQVRNEARAADRQAKQVLETYAPLLDVTQELADDELYVGYSATAWSLSELPLVNR